MNNSSGFLAKGSLGKPDKDEQIASLDPRLSRSNYFDGRLLKATDLTRDQIYLDERAREIGRTLGSGIVHGLETTLSDDYRIAVTPGMALTPSGRVLELADKSLQASLSDHAKIDQYNPRRHTHLARGLYAVVLHYTEIGSDAAEVYPRDLAEERKFHFNSYAEGVVLTLVPLRTPLPSDNPLQARSALVREFLPYEAQLPEIPADGIALGLLAISHQRPVWLDHNLLRRPLRQAQVGADYQQNLARHYRELLDAVMRERRAAGLDGDFQASQHFRLLPPAGPLPKSAIDPVSGRQGFFPDGYRVHIAPVRRDEVETLMRESMALPVLDLESRETANIMILAPLSDTDFVQLARRLELDPGRRISQQQEKRMPGFDPLRLRLFPPSHSIDTDSNTWSNIWSRVADDELLYVSRPPRAAETHISGVVLANGYELPDSDAINTDDTAKSIVIDNSEDLEKAQARVAELELTVNRLRNLLNDANDPQSDNRDEIIEALEAENNLLRTQRDEAMEALEGLREAAETANEEREKRRILETNLDRLKEKLAKEEARSAELDQRLKDNSVDMDRWNLAKERIEKLQTKKEEQDARIRQLEADKTRIKNEADNARRSLDAMNEQIASLRETLRLKTNLINEYEKYVPNETKIAINKPGKTS